MKVANIVGARPQLIKAAMVSRALRKRPAIREVIIHTGQHYDARMSDIFFEELEIPAPSYNLGIGSGTHGAQTGRMIEAIEKVLLEERPDWVLVHGDTNSALAGALAGAKLHVRVGHVEAGLRSFNRRMPEEINRVLTDHASDLLFAPTRAAVENLVREGLSAKSVVLAGDVMYDAALHYGTLADARSRIVVQLALAVRSYVLATIHRAENTDDPVRLRSIFEALGQVSEVVPVVLPLHPRTAAALERERIGLESWPRLSRIEPVSYLDMIQLERHARLIVTDSGGLQKEAFFHRVPCVTLRDETEWVELVEIGWNRILPPSSPEAVVAGLREALEAARPAEPAAPLYGTGQAAECIVRALESASP